MILAKHVLTIYNKYMSMPSNWQGGTPPSASEAWNRTVIKFGQWEDSTDKNADTSGKNFIDKHISIIIPITANTGGKKYKKPLEWVSPFNTTWTLSIGTIIVFGEAPEITSAYTMTNMKANFKYCEIKAIEDLTDQPIMPHFEILGI